MKSHKYYYNRLNYTDKCGLDLGNLILIIYQCCINAMTSRFVFALNI